MNKTLNVNIGGLPFVIDEDAHLMLRSYLNQIESRLTPLEKAEIMEDVENRIADIFSQSVNIRMQVINSIMVQKAIEIIGSADAFGEPRHNQPFNREAIKEVFSKRFYRSRKNRVLAGVCGGLSSYIDVDVSIIRIVIFILGIGSAGSFFLIYLILWIAVPEEPIQSNFFNPRNNERR